MLKRTINANGLAIQVRSRAWVCKAAAALIVLCPGISSAEIIWSGNFDTGDFTQYHSVSDPNAVLFFQMPEYGIPIQYGSQQMVGNGDLLALVSNTARTIGGVAYPQGPTRGGNFAARFTVKNSQNGQEPRDCDGSDCSQRRTQLTMQSAMQPNYQGLPNMSERWISFSIYLPADYEFEGSSWGQQLWELKPTNDGGSGDTFGVWLTSNRSWSISHNWQRGEPQGFAPIAQQMRYNKDYPTPQSDWPDGSRSFATAQSRQELGNILLGGWTDWIIQVRFDHRGSDAGGTGFFRIWKRNEGSEWVQILDIKPGTTTRMGNTFNHGIGVDARSGYGPKIGVYSSKNRVWNNARNTVVYFANHKIGDPNSSFADMTPDNSNSGGGGQGGSTKPRPPSFVASN